MKKFIFYSALSLFIFSPAHTATVVPDRTPVNHPVYKDLAPEMLVVIAKLKIKEIELVLGRKLKLIEKAGIKIFQWKIKNTIVEKKKKGEKNKGETAKMLGIFALGALLITPFAYVTWLAAIPLAIIAIANGNNALKQDKNNKDAKTGVLLGWITLGLLAIGVIAIMALVLLLLGSWV